MNSNNNNLSIAFKLEDIIDTIAVYAAGNKEIIAELKKLQDIRAELLK